MKLFIYAVYDSVAKCYSQPMYLQDDAVAIRSVRNVVTKEDRHPWSVNPEDFSLFCIGEYNDEDGVITPIKEKKVDFVTFVREQPELREVKS